MPLHLHRVAPASASHDAPPTGWKPVLPSGLTAPKDHVGWCLATKPPNTNQHDDQNLATHLLIGIAVAKLRDIGTIKGQVERILSLVLDQLRIVAIRDGSTEGCIGD